MPLDSPSPNRTLRRQNADLRARLEEAEETLGAIRSGEVDAITVNTPTGDQVFTLTGAELAYRVMVETMAEGAITLTADGTILYCNQRFSDMMRADLSTIIGSSFPAFFSADDAAKLRAAIREAQSRTVREQATLLACDAASVPVTVAMHGQSLNGASSVIGTVVTDLSEVLAAENKRRASEVQYRSLVNTINDGLLQVDENLVITFVNPRFARLLGYPETDLLGRRTTEFMDEAARQSVPALVERRKGGIEERYELTWLARDGHSVLTLISARPLFDQDHRYRGSVSVVADLTETKHIETARDNLAGIVETAEDAITGKNLQGFITYWNKGAERLYGYTAEEVIGKPISVVAPPECPDEVADLIARIDRGEIVEQHETERLTKSGKRISVSLRMSPIRDDYGRLTGISTISRDITGRLRAAVELRAAALYTRSLIEASLDPLVTISAEGRITDVNEATVNATGVPRSQLIGSDFSNYFTEPDKARAGYREAFAKGFVSDYPLSIRHVAGRITDVLYNAGVYRDEKDQVAGLFAAARDVTAQRQAEDRLRFSQERLALALKAGGAGTFDWDIRNNINHWSPEAEDLYGVPRGGFGGTFEAWTELVFPDDLAAVKAAIETSLKTGSFAGEWRVRRPDGRMIWLTASATVLFGADSRPERMIGVNFDITARKHAEMELQTYQRELEQVIARRTAALSAANAKLEAANQELEGFSYSVSHDLRTPLRAVDGFSRILLEDYAEKLDAEGQRVLNVVRDSTVRMNHLIDDILAFSRIGRTEMKLAPVDMAALVRNTVADGLATATAGRQLAIDIGVLPDTDGDAAMLRRVWVNLIDNAIKFTAPKPDAHIEVGATAGNDETIYYVRDNGAGFDMQYAPKLFGVFQRLHGTEFPGTGVGLAIVKKIVTRHGGRVWAEGKVGDGAMFCFALPRARVEPQTGGPIGTSK